MHTTQSKTVIQFDNLTYQQFHCQNNALKNRSVPFRFPFDCFFVPLSVFVFVWPQDATLAPIIPTGVMQRYKKRFVFHFAARSNIIVQTNKINKLGSFRTIRISDRFIRVCVNIQLTFLIFNFRNNTRLIW